MEHCARWHSPRSRESNNWRVGCTQLRWATGSRLKKRKFQTNGADSFITKGSRRYVFARNFATANLFAFAGGFLLARYFLKSIGSHAACLLFFGYGFDTRRICFGSAAWKFFRKDSIILNVYKFVPFLDVLA